MGKTVRNTRKPPVESDVCDPFPWVRVEWIDSCEVRDNSDLELHQLPEPQNLLQCGFLVKDLPEYVVVSGAIKTQGREGPLFDYSIAIPKVAVVSITQLQPKV